MKKLILIIFPLLFVLCSCSDTYTSHSFFAMDTFITLDAEGVDEETLREFEALVYADEKRYSRTFSGSGIYEFNKSGDGSVLDDETVSLLRQAFDICENTDGAFSPCLGALSDLWNIKSEDPKVPEEEEIRRILAYCTPSGISEKNGVFSRDNDLLLLDLGAIAKGKGAQNCIEFLKSKGVENAVISFGGSIACIGSSKKSTDLWKIGIKNPFYTDEIAGSLSITDTYIAVSGAYERYFLQNGKRYHHILDPSTGYPAESDIESVAVVSGNGVLSDALSTALFVMGKDKALALYDSDIYDFDAVIITKDGTVYITEGLHGSFDFNENACFTEDKKLVFGESKGK